MDPGTKWSATGRSSQAEACAETGERVRFTHARSCRSPSGNFQRQSLLASLRSGNSLGSDAPRFCGAGGGRCLCGSGCWDRVRRIVSGHIDNDFPFVFVYVGVAFSDADPRDQVPECSQIAD